MEFTFPDWTERTRWRRLCQIVPDFLKLYTTLRELQGKKIHQTEARAVAVLYDAAVKGVDEWERKVNASSGSAVTTKPLAGAQRMAKVESNIGGADINTVLDAYALLAVILHGVVNEVDAAGVYHLYPFAATECQGPDELVNDLLQGKSGYVRYTGQVLWEKGLPTLSQLYIYGHCEPGVHKMHDDTQHKILDCRQLAMRVRACGLQLEFSGRVKIFGCSSGKANPEDDERAFADVFAQAMRQFGYYDCEYFGYAEDLRASGQVQAKTGHKYTHTKDLPSYSTSLRNPNYSEQVVQKALKKVYRKQGYGHVDEYDLLLKEEVIRDAVHQARLEEARVWYQNNESRASDVRVQF